MRGISPIISAVLLIAIIFGLAAIISPWLFNLTTDTANQTSSAITQQIRCQSTSYDFDTSFGNSGISYNLTPAADVLDVKIVNTGTINLHSFSMEIEINTTTGLEIKQLAVNTTSQKTLALPLKPGESAILKANRSEDLNGTLRELKIINGVCPSTFIRQRI